MNGKHKNKPAYCVSVVCLHCCSHIYITERHNTSLTPDRCKAGGGGHTAECLPCEKPLCFRITPTNIFPVLFNQEVKCILGTGIITAAGFTRTGENRVEKSHTSIESMQVLTCLPACLGLNLDPPAVGRQHKLWSHVQNFFSSYLNHKTCNFSAKLNHC